MLLDMLKGKIHCARITECELYYEGSLGIDLDILDQANILPYEKILVVNATNGERLETYTIPAKRGSKTFCLNGAAARLGAVGDMLTIMAFARVPQEDAVGIKPRVVVLDKDNEIVSVKN